MSWKGLGSIIAGFVLLFYLGSSSFAQEAQPRVMARGKTLFEQNCSICHGDKGTGDGPAAYLLFPKPRDFTTKGFKVRTTPSGSVPTDNDLLQTITNGMPGSAMPSFGYLPERDRKALVAYVKKLGEITEKPEKVIQVSAEPKATPQLFNKGNEAYIKLKCWECHGYEGRGDGPSAATLKDDLGNPIPPNNFRRGIYKGGGKNSDIYLRFVTGMDGTPMPSFEDSANEEERWALVHYVRSLAGPKVAAQPGREKITVQRIKGPLPEEPLAAVWDKVPGVRVPLILLWQRQESPDSVLVKAVHNGSEIAFLLEWEDPRVAGNLLRSQDFPDAAAIQFSLTPQAPNFIMGEKGKPVNIWHWRMDRQLDLAGFRDLEQVYKGMVADDYQLERERKRPGEFPVTAAPAHNPTYITGWGAGNFASNPEKATAVENLNAESFGTLTSKPFKEQKVRGRGFWVGEKWKVVFVRKMTSSSSFDVQFKPGGEVPVSFAVWDGNQDDRDGQKSITPWQRLIISR